MPDERDLIILGRLALASRDQPRPETMAALTISAIYWNTATPATPSGPTTWICLPFLDISNVLQLCSQEVLTCGRLLFGDTSDQFIEASKKGSLRIVSLFDLVAPTSQYANQSNPLSFLISPHTKFRLSKQKLPEGHQSL